MDSLELVTTAAGVELDGAYSEIDLFVSAAWPELVVELGEQNTYASAFVSDLAWPELSGSITVGDSYSASLPVSGNGIGLLATLDSATLSFTVAPVELQATLFMGFVVELSTVSAAAGFVGALDLPVAFSGTLVSCGVALDATLSIGTAFSFVATANPVTLSASYLLGSLFSADLVAAGVRLNSGSLVTDLVFAGSLVSAMPWLSADLRIDGGGSVEVWLVNARTRGIAQYSDYPFQSFALLGNGLLLAGATDGLYLMDSTTDAGKEIAGVVEVGTSDMGSATVKYVTDAVLDCEGSGDLSLSIISDGGKIREYSTSIDHQGLQQNRRVKLAKGIKSRYWSARLSLPVGVSVASLELRPDATRRSA